MVLYIATDIALENAHIIQNIKKDIACIVSLGLLKESDKYNSFGSTYPKITISNRHAIKKDGHKIFIAILGLIKCSSHLFLFRNWSS
jgi:hypothetical protein